MAKGERLELRIGAKDLYHLAEAAERSGMTVSAFVRVAAVGAAERMLENDDAEGEL